MALELKEFTPEALVKFAETLDAELKASTKATEDKFVELKAAIAAVPTSEALEEVKKTAAGVETLTKSFADTVQKTQDLALALNDIKKQLDHPLYGSGAEHDDALRKGIIEQEKILFNAKRTDITQTLDEKQIDFKRHLLVNEASKQLVFATGADDYMHKLSKLPEDARKALSMSQIDGSFFFPEVQTAIRDCFLEPVGLFDLYDTFSVSKMTFMYPFIKDHTMLGGYVCSDDCGTVNASNINLQFRREQVYDWRGTLCVTTRTLADSSIDLLALVARATRRGFPATASSSRRAGCRTTCSR